MKARTRRRTASSRGSNQTPPAKGDGDVAAADVASVMAWVPSRSCRSEPTPPQLFPTNLAPRPALAGNRGRKLEVDAFAYDEADGSLHLFGAIRDGGPVPLTLTLSEAREQGFNRLLA